MSKTAGQSLFEIKERLLRHLRDDNRINHASSEFGAIRSNFKRVDYVRKLMKEYKLEINSIKDDKNEEEAVRLRQLGNDMFNREKLKEAHEFYTKSVAFGEENKGESLGLAYANRSAVLFEAGLIEECMEDIQRALANHYPDHLKPKLLTRMKNCKNLEPSRNLEKYRPYEPLEKLPHPNPAIRSASSALKIHSTPELGRHLVATRDIKPGEILAIERPFASVLVSGFYTHCHECLKVCYNLVACRDCTQSLYCSEHCQKRAYESYHKFECPILATARLGLELDKLKMLALKIALMTRDSQGDLTKLALDDTSEVAIYRSDRYREIHDLVTNENLRTVGDLFHRATAAALIFNLVKYHSKFFDDSPQHEDGFKDVILRHLQTGPSNFHEISELFSSDSGSASKTFEAEEIACGAFSFLSLFNHSCCPNVTRNCHGDTVVVRCIGSIRKGEECLDNYGYHYATHSKTERQSQLKSQYLFDCRCVACENDWPRYEDLPEIQGVPDIDEDLMAKLLAADLDVAKSSLDEYLKKLEGAEKFKPCKNFCNLEELVKRCFAIFGNKRRLF